MKVLAPVLRMLVQLSASPKALVSQLLRLVVELNLLCFPLVSYGEYLNNFIDNIIEQEKLSNKKN